jgi:hypothetical protein
MLKGSGLKPRRKPETGQPAKGGKEAKAGKDASDQPETETMLGKLRRWAG